MVVAIERGLENLKNKLEKRGFNVVYIENYNYPVDAIIYERNFFNISHVSRNNMPEATMGERCSYGVLMINSKGKTINEIEDMLKKRYYTPLF
ncbi:YkuS family protein [Herbivorax alkaliphila]